MPWPGPRTPHGCRLPSGYPRFPGWLVTRRRGAAEIFRARRAGHLAHPAVALVVLLVEARQPLALVRVYQIVVGNLRAAPCQSRFEPRILAGQLCGGEWFPRPVGRGRRLPVGGFCCHPRRPTTASGAQRAGHVSPRFPRELRAGQGLQLLPVGVGRCAQRMHHTLLPSSLSSDKYGHVDYRSEGFFR